MTRLLARLERAPARAHLAVLLGAFVLVYLARYASYPDVPSLAPGGREGWLGWWDQGKYLRSARAFVALDLSASSHHYPFGYPLLALPFLEMLPRHPWLVPNLVLATAGVGLLFGIAAPLLGRTAATALLLATSVAHPVLVEELVVPWTSIPVRTAVYAASWLLLRRTRSFRTGLALGALAGAAFVCRPADVLFFAPLGLGFLVPAGPRGTRGAFIRGLLAGGTPWLMAHLALNLAIFGSATSRYVEVQRTVGFSLSHLPFKLHAVLFGAETTYRVADPMLVATFPWLVLAPAGVVAGAWLFPERRSWILANGAAIGVGVLFYFASNGVGAWNLVRFHAVHYLAWAMPLAALLAALLVKSLPRLWRRPVPLAAAVLAVLVLVLPAVKVTGRPATLAAAPEDWQRLRACGPTGGEGCLVEARLEVRGCAQAIDLHGLVATRFEALALEVDRRRREENLGFVRTTYPGGTRLNLFQTVCDTRAVLHVRAAAAVAGAVTATTYRFRVRPLGRLGL